SEAGLLPSQAASSGFASMISPAEFKTASPPSSQTAGVAAGLPARASADSSASLMARMLLGSKTAVFIILARTAHPRRPRPRPTHGGFCCNGLSARRPKPLAKGILAIAQGWSPTDIDQGK